MECLLLYFFFIYHKYHRKWRTNNVVYSYFELFNISNVFVFVPTIILQCWMRFQVCQPWHCIVIQVYNTFPQTLGLLPWHLRCHQNFRTLLPETSIELCADAASLWILKTSLQSAYNVLIPSIIIRNEITSSLLGCFLTFFKAMQIYNVGIHSCFQRLHQLSCIATVIIKLYTWNGAKTPVFKMLSIL